MVGEAKVSALRIVRNLGTWCDMDLTMSAHINNTYRAVIYHLYTIKRTSRYLSYDNRTIYSSSSHIDYCNSLLVGVPTTLSKLQRLQNEAARLVRMLQNMITLLLQLLIYIDIQ